jgi:membrane protease YdiL (CAAX protease family)
MKAVMKNVVRPIAVTIAVPTLGFAFAFLGEQFLDMEISRLVISVFNLVVVSIFAFFLFPRVFGIPFGKVSVRDFLKRLGFSFPPQVWKHIGLGLLLAACTLGGMLMASVLSGQYEVDLSQISLTQVIFSLNPGIWEELFYRGILMVILIRLTGSLRKGAIIQILLFGLMHIKGFEFWNWIDMFTVILLAVSFTYVAYKTQSLVAGIIFHFTHDALLFFVQVPDETVLSTFDHIVFFGLLWLMTGVAMFLTRILVDRFGIQSGENLYALEPDVQ